MKTTSIGKAFLLLIFLTLWNAVNGGLNTLYMAFAALAASVLISWAGVRIAAALLRSEATLPEQLFAGESAPIELKLTNRAFFPLMGVSIVSKSGRTRTGDIPARGSRTEVISYRFMQRGLTDATDISAEFRFPFGIFAMRAPIRIVGALVFPREEQLSGRPELHRATFEEISIPRRGAGDELWGLREYAAGDDIRLISWKLTAKLGRPVVREFAETVGERVIIDAAGSPPGEAAERSISEAAATARFFIDEGSEVKLSTDEGDIDFGRGLIHLGLILKKLALLGDGGRRRTTGAPPKLSEPAPNLKLLGWATLFFSAIAAASLFLAEGIDYATKVAVAGSVALGFAFDRRGSHPIPAFILNIAGLAVIAAEFAIDLPARGLLPGLTHLIGWALIDRSLSRKNARDLHTIALISALLFIVVSWQTISPIYLAAFAAIAFASSIWCAVASGAVSRIDRRAAMSIAAVAAATLLLAGAIFAATPRVANPRFARMMRQLGLSNLVAPEHAIVKLADRISLGDFEGVRTSGRRVMQVRVTGIEVPKNAAIYVRGGALDRFDGKTWSRSHYDFPYDYFGRPIFSSNGRALYEKRGDVYAAPGYGAGRPEAIAEFFIYPMATALVFSIGDPSSIAGDALMPSFDLTGTVQSTSTYDRGGHYTVSSKSFDIRLDEAIEGYDDALATLYMGLPMDDGVRAAAQIAREVAGSTTSTEGKADAIEDFLRKKFSYSYLGAHGRQSLKEFLTQTRAGNCEYFATAMAVMLRALGIPSRVAIGYMSAERSQVGEFFDVRDSDGHAWVEAYLPGRGWASFDPTPEAGPPAESALPFGRELTRYILGMQMSWYRYIIGYDFYLQQDVLGSILARWRDIAASVAAAAAAFASVLAGAAALRRYAPRRRHAAPPAGLRIWLDAEELLARFGFRRRSGQTPFEFAREVSNALPEVTSAMKFVAAFYAARYAGSDADEANSAFAEMAAQLGRHGEATISFKKQGIPHGKTL